MGRQSEADVLAHKLALDAAESEVWGICLHVQDGWWRLPTATAPEIEQPDADSMRYLELRGAIEYDELRQHVRLVEPKA